ncbi:MAG: hypothetical protein AAF493_25410 [Pseudomonadota bacterium]
MKTILRRPVLTRAALAIGATLIAGPVVAADVTIQVSKTGNGAAVRDAAVCIGTQANPAQFGVGLADRNGRVRFQNLPNARLVITAAKPGMKSRRVTVPGTVGDRSIVLAMSAGGGGPTCGEAVAAANPTIIQPASNITNFAPGVRGFRINGGDRSTASREVRLDFAVSNNVTHVRASERSDFGDAKWEPATGANTFELSDRLGRKRIYFQARRLLAVEGAELQSLSDVVSDTIVLDKSDG